MTRDEAIQKVLKVVEADLKRPMTRADRHWVRGHVVVLEAVGLLDIVKAAGTCGPITAREEPAQVNPDDFDNQLLDIRDKSRSIMNWYRVHLGDTLRSLQACGFRIYKDR